MKDPIKSSEQRTQRYWYIDGLTELGFGFVCLLLAGYFFLQATLPDASPASQYLNLALMAFIFFSSYAFRYAVRKVKERITSPRTGYVAYRRTPHHKRLALIAAALFSAGIFAAVLSFFILGGQDQWMAAVSGLIIAAIWAILGYRLIILRFFALAGFSLAAGLLASLIHLDQEMGLVVYYGLFSLAMLVSGGLTLQSYLRASPPPNEAQV